jgi:hypothetical protein
MVDVDAMEVALCQMVRRSASITLGIDKRMCAVKLQIDTPHPTQRKLCRREWLISKSEFDSVREDHNIVLEALFAIWQDLVSELDKPDVTFKNGEDDE